MQYKIDETNFNVTMTAANFDVVVTASAPLEVAVGESARLDVSLHEQPREQCMIAT